MTRGCTGMRLLALLGLGEVRRSRDPTSVRDRNIGPDVIFQSQTDTADMVV
jgi:hypothetical protein